MLCPAVILAWTSVVLLVPGISRSEKQQNMQNHQQSIIISVLKEERATGKDVKAV